MQKRSTLRRLAASVPHDGQVDVPLTKLTVGGTNFDAKFDDPTILDKHKTRTVEQAINGYNSMGREHGLENAFKDISDSESKGRGTVYMVKANPDWVRGKVGDLDKKVKLSGKIGATQRYTEAFEALKVGDRTYKYKIEAIFKVGSHVHINGPSLSKAGTSLSEDQIAAISRAEVTIKGVQTNEKGTAQLYTVDCKHVPPPGQFRGGSMRVCRK